VLAAAAAAADKFALVLATTVRKAQSATAARKRLL